MARILPALFHRRRRLTNAAQYSERGSAIRISAVREGAGVALSVSDEGIGIAPDMLSKVFDTFTHERLFFTTLGLVMVATPGRGSAA
jgi:signal transduction histidine kinase